MRFRGVLAAAVTLIAAAAWFVPAGAVTGTTVTATVLTGTGYGFDACNGPSTATLRGWSASPYTNVNAYIGGVNLSPSCVQRTDADWATTVLSNGWSLIPTYVGRQAPCSTTSDATHISSDTGTAFGQGSAAAVDAMQILNNDLHLPGAVVYLDLEPFSSGDASCVSSFAAGWSQTLHAGLDNVAYKSGIYVNAGQGASVFVNAYTSPAPTTQADDIWVADYNNSATADDAVLQGTWPHHRLHQFHGGTDETYGGVTVNIDGDAVDGDVVAASSVAVAGYNVSAPGTGLNERSQPNTAATAIHNWPDKSSLSISCQATGQAINGDIVWDRLSDGGYVADVFTTTTGRNTFSSLIPKCDTTRPSASMHALHPVTLGSAVNLAWSASDPANPNGETSGIASSQVRYRYASWHGGWGAWHTRAPTTARSTSLGLSVGYSYCVQVRATDLSGNTSAWSAQTCTERPLDDRSMTASAGWSRRTSTHFYLHTYTQATRSSRTLTRTSASLDRVGIVATRCSTCGAVRVYVGSAYVGTISLHASSARYQQVLLLKSFSSRSGTIRLVTTSGQLVQMDGLVILRF